MMSRTQRSYTAHISAWTTSCCWKRRIFLSRQKENTDAANSHNMGTSKPYCLVDTPSPRPQPPLGHKTTLYFVKNSTFLGR